MVLQVVTLLLSALYGFPRCLRTHNYSRTVRFTFGVLHEPFIRHLMAIPTFTKLDKNSPNVKAQRIDEHRHLFVLIMDVPASKSGNIDNR